MQSYQQCVENMGNTLEFLPKWWLSTILKERGNEERGTLRAPAPARA